MESIAGWIRVDTDGRLDTPDAAFASNPGQGRRVLAATRRGQLA
jgi:hypothetical protein